MDLVYVLLGKQVIVYQWVYKIKRNLDESIKHYKKCLVTKGFFQEYGLDYVETFVPVVTMTIVYTLIVVDFVLISWKSMK